MKKKWKMEPSPFPDYYNLRQILQKYYNYITLQKNIDSIKNNIYNSNITLQKNIDSIKNNIYNSISYRKRRNKRW